MCYLPQRQVGWSIQGDLTRQLKTANTHAWKVIPSILESGLATLLHPNATQCFVQRLDLDFLSISVISQFIRTNRHGARLQSIPTRWKAAGFRYMTSSEGPDSTG